MKRKPPKVWGYGVVFSDGTTAICEGARTVQAWKKSIPGLKAVTLVAAEPAAEAVVKAAIKLTESTRGQLGFLDVPGRIDVLVAAVARLQKARGDR